jgi:predicted Na+-dependent transporter
VLRGLTWLGARARWVLAVGVLLATLLPSLSAFLRPYLPALVVLVLAISMARMDLGALARRARRPRRLAGLAVWALALTVITPVIVWAGARTAGLPEAQLAALVYTFVAPPIASSPALCLMLGLEAGFALELTVLASLANPVVGPAVAKLLLGEAVPLDALDLTLRIAVMIGGGAAAALVLRRLVGAERIIRHGGAFDGAAAIVVVLFVIPLYHGFWEVVTASPWFAFGTFALVLAANWGPQVVMALGAGRVADPGVAGAAALMWGNRNSGMYLAALPPDPVFGLYVAFYQLPMLFTPLVLGRLLRGRRSDSCR